jgi:hypothetical protein
MDKTGVMLRTIFTFTYYHMFTLLIPHFLQTCLILTDNACLPHFLTHVHLVESSWTTHAFLLYKAIVLVSYTLPSL